MHLLDAVGAKTKSGPGGFQTWSYRLSRRAELSELQCHPIKGGFTSPKRTNLYFCCLLKDITAAWLSPQMHLFSSPALIPSPQSSVTPSPVLPTSSQNYYSKRCCEKSQSLFENLCVQRRTKEGAVEIAVNTFLGRTTLHIQTGTSCLKMSSWMLVISRKGKN